VLDGGSRGLSSGDDLVVKGESIVLSLESW
jgi:hypothetical protein